MDEGWSCFSFAAFHHLIPTMNLLLEEGSSLIKTAETEGDRAVVTGQLHQLIEHARAIAADRKHSDVVAMLDKWATPLKVSEPDNKEEDVVEDVNLDNVAATSTEEQATLSVDGDVRPTIPVDPVEVAEKAEKQQEESLKQSESLEATEVPVVEEVPIRKQDTKAAKKEEVTSSKESKVSEQDLADEILREMEAESEHKKILTAASISSPVEEEGAAVRKKVTKKDREEKKKRKQEAANKAKRGDAAEGN